MEEETWEQEEDDKKEFVEEVTEAAEYSQKSDFSKAQIVYSQNERCCLLRSDEMRSGYSTHIVDKIGNVKLVHIPDARKKFIGAVNALMNLLYPEILRDDIVKENVDEFKEVKEELKTKYLYKEKKLILKEGKMQLIPTGREYIPEIGEIVVVGMKAVSKGVMGESRVEGHWDAKVNAYYSELLDVYDILFAELNRLIDKLNYFKQSMNF